jgi:hypothetical protein
MDGQGYDYANGMFGKAESIVRNEPIAYAFVPSLKQWVDRMTGEGSESSGKVEHAPR